MKDKKELSKVGNNKVAVRERDLIQMSNGGVRVTLYTEQEDEWKQYGWRTSDSKKAEAEEKMQKVKELQKSRKETNINV